MHTGKRYTNLEVLLWTRRNIYKLFVVGLIPVLLYQIFDLSWLALPWTVAALLGTATAFIVGFRNSQTYNRTWEARQIWGGILNLSRAWGIYVRDFIDDEEKTKLLYYRHFAWLTTLRYAMREQKPWETMDEVHNAEYQNHTFEVPEKLEKMEDVLVNYLSDSEVKYILTTKNKPAQLLSLQSKTLKELNKNNELSDFRFVELERMLKDLYDMQGRSERIKNFPYPRQFATINNFLVVIFVYMLPFAMLREFEKMNETVEGILKGHMVWFVIPFSMLISWVFTSLDQIGQSTENPFEGNANDVPISQMSRTIEIDMREMLGETDLPPALQPKNKIIL